MTRLNNEKNILNIIRFGAIIAILILSITITYSMIKESNTKIEKEMEIFKENYLIKNKTYIKNEVYRTITLMNYEINNSEKSLKLYLKEKVYEAHAIATNIYDTQSSLLKNEDISKMIKNTLGTMIYNNGNGYIFMDDINGVKVLQPLNKDLEGKNLSEFTDAKGYRFMKKIIDTIKNKTEAYDEYYWFKSKDDKTAYKKISFYKYFKPFNYAIGTGEYLLDFEKRIQDEFLNKINEINFNDDSYIFIFNKDGKYLSHFNKNKIGTNAFNLKDPNGKYIIKDIYDFIKKNKEGYIQYIAPLKPNSDKKNVEKISYVKYFEKWDLIIGSGFYLDELNEALDKKEIELRSIEKDIINNILIIAVFITIILLIISVYISKLIELKFSKYKKDLEKEISNTIEKEKLLIQQSKMATMGEMIANIAHQWKQPLSLISMSNGLLKLNQEDNTFSSEEEIKKAITNIDISVKHLSNTIDDFRNFFIPDKQKVYFKLKTVYEKTYRLLSSQFKNNNIQIIVELEDVEILGYPNELLQVLINIIKNARDELIKGNSDNKKIIFINGYKENKKIILKIKDNAGGIPKDIIDEIFNAYFTTKKDGEGTGIGLYMSKQIIEHMNGIIQVSNVNYKYADIEYLGAEFVIELQQ